MYHLEELHNSNGTPFYVAFPYDSHFVLMTYLDIDFARTNWRAWLRQSGDRFADMVDWMRSTRFSEKSAKRLAKKKNRRVRF